MKEIIEESFKDLCKLDNYVQKGFQKINQYDKEIKHLFNEFRKLGILPLTIYKPKRVNILYKKKLSKTNLEDIFFMIDQYTKARNDILCILLYQRKIHSNLHRELINNKRKFEDINDQENMKIFVNNISV
jgi:hypothetical protein